METKKEELKEEEIQLLITGINDSASLLNEDELSDIFGGYICNRYVSCYSSYYGCYEGY